MSRNFQIISNLIQENVKLKLLVGQQRGGEKCVILQVNLTAHKKKQTTVCKKPMKPKNIEKKREREK